MFLLFYKANIGGLFRFPQKKLKDLVFGTILRVLGIILRIRDGFRGIGVEREGVLRSVVLMVINIQLQRWIIVCLMVNCVKF